MADLEQEAENTPMTWLDLARQHLTAVQQAKRIVEGYQVAMRRPGLLGELEDWQDALADLDKRLTRVNDQYESEQLDAEIAESDRILAQILSDSIQLTSSHLTGLENVEQPQPEAFDQVLRDLEYHSDSFLGAGPHGPGGGRPTTSGSGNKGGGTLWRSGFETLLDVGTHGSGGGRPRSEYVPQTAPALFK
jgi:hypothetical protein